MKLFIVDKSSVEAKVGAENLTKAHKDCYGKLAKSVNAGLIPLHLSSRYDENNIVQFVFNKLDKETEIFFYDFQFISGC